MTRSSCLTLALALALATSLGAQGISVRADDPRAAYAPGETATFTVESEQRGELTYALRYDLRGGDEPIATGTLTHDGPSTEIPIRFDSAAFVVLEVTIGADGYGVAGATFGREDVLALGDEPADFDAFWAAERAALDEVPVDLRLDGPERREYSDVYTFSAAQLDGRRVYGHIVVPRGEGIAGPFPATLRLPPFGQSPNVIGPDVQMAERAGCLAVSVNIHDAPSDTEDPNAYEPDDPTRREGVYYRYAVAAARRAIDVIAARDDWNGQDLCVYGDSQGGGLSFLTAAADDRVTHLMQAIAALSQHGGYLAGRPSGFPYYLETAAVTGASLADVYEAVSYYDAAFAARRFGGPSLHFVNYLDDVCPPATHYAAVNELDGPRVVLHSLDLAHNNPEEFTNERGDFLREYLSDAPAPPFPFGDPSRGHYVDAGEDVTAAAGATVALSPEFGFDGVAGGSPDWTAGWELVDGPGEFDVLTVDPRTGAAEVRFRQNGTYRLRLRVVDPYREAEGKWWELIDDVAVEVSGMSALSDGPEAPGLTLLPNPVHDEFTVAVGDEPIANVELRDAVGRVVHEAVGRERVGVRGLQPGAYVAIVRLVSGEVLTGRVVIR